MDCSGSVLAYRSTQRPKKRTGEAMGFGTAPSSFRDPSPPFGTLLTLGYPSAKPSSNPAASPFPNNPTFAQSAFGATAASAFGSAFGAAAPSSLQPAPAAQPFSSAASSAAASQRITLISCLSSLLSLSLSVSPLLTSAQRSLSSY
jgi:hypothetical protein